MSAELFDRRGLFTRWYKPTVAIGAALEARYATKLFEPRYEITPDKKAWLDDISLQLSEHIQFFGLNLPIRVGNISGTIAPDPIPFSKSFVYLAYLDGGEERVGQVKQTITQRGLDVAASSEPTPFSGSVSALSPILGGRIVMSISPNPVKDYFKEMPKPSADAIVWHETYHIIQQIRDNMWSLVHGILSITAVGPLIAEYSWKIADRLESGQEVPDDLRRKFMACLTALAVLLPLVYYIRPVESQAYLFVEGPLDLTKDKFFSELRGRLFTLPIRDRNR